MHGTGGVVRPTAPATPLRPSRAPRDPAEPPELSSGGRNSRPGTFDESRCEEKRYTRQSEEAESSLCREHRPAGNAPLRGEPRECPDRCPTASEEIDVNLANRIQPCPRCDDTEGVPGRKSRREHQPAHEGVSGRAFAHRRAGQPEHNECKRHEVRDDSAIALKGESSTGPLGLRPLSPISATWVEITTTIPAATASSARRDGRANGEG